MRQRLLLLTLALALAGLFAPAASQAATSTLSIKAKLTRFYAHGSSLNASGLISGTLKSGSDVKKDSAPVRFRVTAAQNGRRCNILTLNLQKLHLDLLGARVDTSAINLELYAKRGRILGNLFCAVTHARIRLPRAAAAMNHTLNHRPLRVMSAHMKAQAAQTPPPATCQVLDVILGPLHLDLLGLNVDLYGRTKSDPVEVTITAVPGEGLLGDVLCSLAGHGNITTLAGLQGLLKSVGVTVADPALQTLLTSLGITLVSGRTNAALQRILQGLQPPPSR